MKREEVLSFRDSAFACTPPMSPLRERNPALRGSALLISRVTVFIILVFGLAAELRAQQPGVEEPRFCAVDIFVDSGSTPLAAYQLWFAVTNGAAKIVGIEGGQHPAFRQPPFYDPKAIQNEVAIIASFNTAPVGELPVGKTRVATIHLRTTAIKQPQFELKLQTAADSRGNKFACVASFEERKEK